MLSTLISSGVGLQLPGTALALRHRGKGKQGWGADTPRDRPPLFASEEGHGCSATPMVAGRPEQGREGKPTGMIAVV